MRLSIRLKLTLLIGTLLLLVVVIGLTAFRQNSFVNAKVRQIADVEHRTSETAYRMEIDLADQSLAVQKYLQHPDPAFTGTLKEDDVKFRDFERNFAALPGNSNAKSLQQNVELSQQLFMRSADTLVHLRDLLSAFNANFEGSSARLSARLDEETYIPEKRFDAHKDQKMRASFRVQAMKVSLDRLRSDVKDLLETGLDKFNDAINSDMKEFKANFSAQQSLARPERKYAFARDIDPVFDSITGIIGQMRTVCTLERSQLAQFARSHRQLSQLLEEQVLLMADRNLLLAKEEALDASAGSNRTILILLIAMLAFGLVAGALFTRGITRPLAQLMQGTRIIAANDLSKKVEVSSRDELGELASSFNQMTGKLNDAREKQEFLLRQVESSNRALTDFAHVVSHDLKAPLRGIHTICGWMAEDPGNKFSSSGAEQLGMIRENVKQLFNMIDAVLHYSRIGHSGMQKENVALDELVTDVTGMLVVPGNIRLEVQEKLPVVHFERILLHQVFQNLMSNAIKYMDKPDGIIRVCCDDAGHCWQLSVNDNGPGIEEKDQERVFRLFQTGRSTQTSDSTGVGLAIVKKIIESAGGKVGVRSKPGEGSAFTFTISKSA
jgi:signal transduction histidine kinase